MDPRIREGDEYGGGLTGARASEAKGPFPGGKRVGSWGKIKGRDPPSAVGGLKGIEKRVGSWGKKKE